MKCPSCETELRMTDRQGVEIDYCPNCRGVWLDRGELDKIIERASFSSRRDDDDDDDHYQPRRDSYPDHRHQGGSYPKKKKRSVLSELFDF